jgi:hypothetical protein
MGQTACPLSKKRKVEITLLPDTLRPLKSGSSLAVLYGVASVKESRDGVRHSDIHASLKSDPTVIAALASAWRDSLPGDARLRHEEGGWIYLDTTTCAISAIRAARGAKAAIDLSNPPAVAGSVVVGKFHTHPNPTVERSERCGQAHGRDSWRSRPDSRGRWHPPFRPGQPTRGDGRRSRLSALAQLESRLFM